MRAAADLFTGGMSPTFGQEVKTQSDVQIPLFLPSAHLRSVTSLVPFGFWPIYGHKEPQFLAILTGSLTSDRCQSFRDDLW
jgi:hypothetical protein